MLVPHQTARAAVATMQIELGVLAHELRRGDAVRAGGMAMGVVAVSSRLQIVDVDGAVAALRGDESLSGSQAMPWT